MHGCSYYSFLNNFSILIYILFQVKELYFIRYNYTSGKVL
jgi:hypothetical protein